MEADLSQDGTCDGDIRPIELDSCLGLFYVNARIVGVMEIHIAKMDYRV